VIAGTGAGVRHIAADNSVRNVAYPTRRSTYFPEIAAVAFGINLLFPPRIAEACTDLPQLESIQI